MTGRKSDISAGYGGNGKCNDDDLVALCIQSKCNNNHINVVAVDIYKRFVAVLRYRNRYRGDQRDNWLLVRHDTGL